MKLLLAVFLGGGLGSMARFGLSRLIISLFPSGFPWGTFAANVLSCLLLAAFVGLIARQSLSSYWFAFLIVGFCGGFSTFSTFSFENVMLIQSGKWALAVANIGLSVVTCIALLIWLLKPTT